MANEMGDKIEEALKEKNMTQKQLAKEAGITEAAVSHYIKGDREPRSNTLGTIAAVLGVTASFLLGMGVGSATTESKMQKFEQIKSLIAENKDGFTDEQKLELVRMLTK